MSIKLEPLNRRQPLKTLDMHTAGEPLRIVRSGYPEIPGDCMLSKRRYLQQHLDHLRKLLMLEPRGHADMYGAVLTDPVTPDGDFGVLFMHNEGYSSMCGHGILAIVTALLECGDLILLQDECRTLRIDSPAGRITAYAKNTAQGPEVSFDSVPSYVDKENLTFNLPGIGQVRSDIAFGGAYYAFIDADELNLECSAENAVKLIDLGRRCKEAINQIYSVKHPLSADLSFLYGVIFTSMNVADERSHSRHACVFADGELDRSPTGTGVSARMALLHHQHKAPLNRSIDIEGIAALPMRVYGHSEQDFHGKSALIPRVSGRAYITGQHQFILDPSDPLSQGLFIR